MLAAADVLAVTQRASVLDMSVPSKLTSYFAGGPPGRRLGRRGGRHGPGDARSGAGVLVAPEDPAAPSCGAVRALAAGPRRAPTQLGGAARPRLRRRTPEPRGGPARIDALLAEALGAAGRGRGRTRGPPCTRRIRAGPRRRQRGRPGRVTARRTTSGAAEGQLTRGRTRERVASSTAGRAGPAARPVPAARALPGLIAAGVAVGLLGGAYLAVSGADTYTATSEVDGPGGHHGPLRRRRHRRQGHQHRHRAADRDEHHRRGGRREGRRSEPVARPLPALPAGHQPAQHPGAALHLHRRQRPGRGRLGQRASPRRTWTTARRRPSRPSRRWSPATRTSSTRWSSSATTCSTRSRSADDSQVVGTLVSVQTNLLSRITELNGDISGLKALDTTPGVVIKPGVAPDVARRPRAADDARPRRRASASRSACSPRGCGWSSTRRPRSEARCPRAGRARARAPCRGPRGAAAGTLLADGRGGRRGSPRSTARSPSGSATTSGSPSGAGCWSWRPRGASDTARRRRGQPGRVLRRDGQGGAAGRGRPAHPVAVRPAATVRTAVAGPAGPGRRASARAAGPPGCQLAVDAGESGSFDLVAGPPRAQRRPRADLRARHPAVRRGRRARHAVVVVLAPPVLAYADALALADRVDGVVVVCDPRDRAPRRPGPRPRTDRRRRRRRAGRGPAPLGPGAARPSACAG